MAAALRLKPAHSQRPNCRAELEGWRICIFYSIFHKRKYSSLKFYLIYLLETLLIDV